MLNAFKYAFSGMLFSGDSQGTVSLWDVDVGGLVTSFTSHRADVLALAASSDNRSVFASGVDSNIRRFDYFQSNDSCKSPAIFGTCVFPCILLHYVDAVFQLHGSLVACLLAADVTFAVWFLSHVMRQAAFYLLPEKQTAF